MTTRQMFDAIHANVSSIPDVVDDVVAGYDTGTADVKWTEADWNKFPGTKVHVDQALGGPVHSATVMDVEAHAYTVSEIPGWIAACTAPRPTCYVNGSELDAALAASKTADIWLASPGMSDSEALALMASNPRIVAVQNVWNKNYDRSIIGDPTWPEAKTVTTPPTPVSTPTPSPVAVTGVSGLHGVAFSMLCAINIAWTAKPGDKPYEWQVERDTDSGWVLEQTGTTSATVASIHNVSPRQTYRFRVSNGEWTPWIEVVTP